MEGYNIITMNLSSSPPKAGFNWSLLVQTGVEDITGGGPYT